MSGKFSLEWRRRHNGHSSSSDPATAPTLEEKEEEEIEAPEADEVEAAATEAVPFPATKKAEFLSLHISEWMLSMVAIPSTPVSPPGPGC